MERKALLHFRKMLGGLCFGIFLGLVGCTASGGEDQSPPSLTVDASMVPADTVAVDEVGLSLDNGIYLLNGTPYSGYVAEKYEDGTTKSVRSLLNGQQHGVSSTFYANGKIRDRRSYKANKSVGRHQGYWENGNPKFDFWYRDDKREGPNKQWYESGQPYAFLHFKDDQEDGLQRTWRKNGKPYINYEAKDGHRYGMQKAALCYTLVDEKLKTDL